MLAVRSNRRAEVRAIAVVCLLALVVVAGLGALIWSASVRLNSEPAFARARGGLGPVGSSVVVSTEANEAASEGLESIPLFETLTPAERAACKTLRGERCADPRPSDHDADGYLDGRDCDDFDFGTHPGAIEHPCDLRDQDCDGADECEADADQDGYPANADCDDTNPKVHPRAEDVHCNGVDEDCTGSDVCDGDGDGVPPPADCDDADPLRSPLKKELVCDAVDQNCDGQDCCDCDWDRDGFPCRDDCDDRAADAYPGRHLDALQRDGCVLRDLDCDGKIDGTNCP